MTIAMCCCQQRSEETVAAIVVVVDVAGVLLPVPNHHQGFGVEQSYPAILSYILFDRIPSFPSRTATNTAISVSVAPLLMMMRDCACADS